MTEAFRTFQKFNDPELAAIIAGKLQELGIETEIVDESANFDPSYANNSFEPTIHLKIKADRFDRAHAVLEEYYQQQVDDVPSHYYLLSFSNRELMEIIAKPDEWGHFDYALAQKLLAERGHPVTPSTIETLKEQRIEELAKPEPEKNQTTWIVLGYFFSVFGSFPGILIGYLLAFTHKTLPNGQNVHLYSPATREHGRKIFFIGLMTLAFWVVYKITH
ncbi:MAG: hypothetical protein JST68_22630 [Bacteroidetes bacterium]|nr:hypothetical protein [Bacteroidota bacterium]